MNECWNILLPRNKCNVKKNPRKKGKLVFSNFPGRDILIHIWFQQLGVIKKSSKVLRLKTIKKQKVIWKHNVFAKLRLNYSIVFVLIKPTNMCLCQDGFGNSLANIYLWKYVAVASSSTTPTKDITVQRFKTKQAKVFLFARIETVKVIRINDRTQCTHPPVSKPTIRLRSNPPWRQRRNKQIERNHSPWCALSFTSGWQICSFPGTRRTHHLKQPRTMRSPSSPPAVIRHPPLEVNTRPIPKHPKLKRLLWTIKKLREGNTNTLKKNQSALRACRWIGIYPKVSSSPTAFATGLDGIAGFLHWRKNSFVWSQEEWRSWERVVGKLWTLCLVKC